MWPSPLCFSHPPWHPAPCQRNRALGPDRPQDVCRRGRDQPPSDWTTGHPGRTRVPECQLSSPHYCSMSTLTWVYNLCFTFFKTRIVAWLWHTWALLPCSMKSYPLFSSHFNFSSRTSPDGTWSWVEPRTSLPHTVVLKPLVTKRRSQHSGGTASSKDCSLSLKETKPTSPFTGSVLQEGYEYFYLGILRGCSRPRPNSSFLLSASPAPCALPVKGSPTYCHGKLCSPWRMKSLRTRAWVVNVPREQGRHSANNRMKATFRWGRHQSSGVALGCWVISLSRGHSWPFHCFFWETVSNESFYLTPSFVPWDRFSDSLKLAPHPKINYENLDLLSEFYNPLVIMFGTFGWDQV